MRARSLRTHHMGTSNRHESINHEQNQAKRHTVMERSFNKTASLRGSQFGQSRMLALQSCIAGDKCNNPFLGGHNEFETQRFDKFNLRPYKQSKIQNTAQKNTLKLANNSNKNIESIKQSFNGKKINMNKLKQLKNSFINNNKNKRNLQQYFHNYSNNESIGQTQFKKLVKQYGFDVNQDQISLIFKLTNQANNSQNLQNKIYIDGFVQLMTKQDIFYETLKFQQNNITFGNNFSSPVHQVLKNKFKSIKEAFNIYKSNNEQIGKKQFDYVMKKLDLTDLVIPQQERNQIFHKYSQDGVFNAESLICAIAQQQNILKIPKVKSEFTQQISAHKQKQFKNSSNPRQFSFSNLSYLQYQNEFKKARQIIITLKQLTNHQNNFISKINQNSNFIEKKQLISKVQNILKKQGMNFSKQTYQAFGAYANCDVNGYVNLEKLNHQIYFQEEKQAKQNFQRKIRKQAPKTENLNPSEYVDHSLAIQSLNKIRQQKLNPQARELFKYLDKDNDGHISCKQFKERMQDINILENWEVQNLMDHFKMSEKGSINFQQFSKKIIQQNSQFKDLPTIQTRNSRNLTNWSEASKTKKSIIQDSKLSTYQNPNRFSAWPSHLTTQDLSLISPHKPMGMHITQADRFNNNKEDLGRTHKAKSLAIADQRIKKISEWNSLLQERSKINEEKMDNKQQSRNYYLRLAQQKYQINCHQ